MNKKPLFDSDVDPKRIKNVADGLRRQGEFESARMLDGYADALEAREKAVPVAYADAATREEILNVAMRKGGYGCEVPLFVHPDPADAERLAEALQPFANLLQPHHASMPDDRPIYGINKAEITAGDLRRANEALAAHSAQAQPPAASVTDGLVDALRHQRQIDEDGAEVGVSRQAVDEAANILAMLAAQESRNG